MDGKQRFFVSYHYSCISKKESGYGDATMVGYAPTTDEHIAVMKKAIADSFKDEIPDMHVVILNFIPLGGAE